MKNIIFKISGIIILTFALVANLQYALFNYGLKNNSIGLQVFAQTGSSGGGSCSGTGTSCVGGSCGGSCGGGGSTGGPTFCLSTHSQIPGSTVDHYKCYRDNPGEDIFEGNTKKCIPGTGCCNEVTCDKLPMPSCYTKIN